MILKDPCCITSRLLPGVRIGDAEVSIGYADRPGREGRTRYRWYVDLPDVSETGDDLQSGCGGGGLRSGLESLLSFLAYADDDLFPPTIMDWAAANSEEIGHLAMMVEETKGCIQE
jgi:hypothetical protein